MSALSRDALRSLAQARFDEAIVLLKAGHWGGAYYLGGFSAELGLKACIAAQFVKAEIPSWAVNEKFKVHTLGTLLGYSGLELELKAACAENEALAENWETVKEWKTDSRYDAMIDEGTARNLMMALGDPNGGVLTWIRTRL